MTTHDTARDALAGRLLEACVASLDLLHVYVGDRLGLYAALATAGPLTADDLAARCSIDPRYAREWAEQQAVAGILALDDDASPGARRYALPSGHSEVLTDADSLAYLAPLGQGVAAVAHALPHVVEAFRSGAGVEFAAYGDDIRTFIARINRPMFLHQLAQEWFPQVPGLVGRLSAAPPARVADLGCGSGWSSIAIARAYPLVTVVGVDLDEASIAEAHNNAAASGVGQRVSFQVADASDPSLAGTFDLVCAFETIHDMNDPTAALASMRALRAPSGTVLVADERVADQFTTDVDAGERFQWGFSALHCLPTAMTAPPRAGTGTIMRTPTFRQYAHAAGFCDVEVLPIEHDFWRFYRLVD